MFIPAENWKKLSHKERRQLISKERRRRKRVLKAEQREEEQAVLENDPDYLEEVCAEERRIAEEERHYESQSVLGEELWLKRERQSQEQFRQKCEAEEKILREREERERLIREEWEALQKKEREEEEKKAQEKRDKEERLQEALRIGDIPLHETSWGSPRWIGDAPSSPPTQIHPSPSLPLNTDYGTEQDTKNCSFYLKTGACRFKERCSKYHPHPQSSSTILLPGMYGSLGFMEQLVDDRDQDTGLEYDEGDMYEHFIEFYKDVLPEFKKAGKVIQFKVSCNYEPHLRGNVYVQFASEDECKRAYQMFNGRWYAQKQLSCEYCPVQKWRSAICGLFNMKKCFKGRHCNFLHVFKNPNREFFHADRDLPPSSPPTHTHRRHSLHNERRGHHGYRHSRDRGRYRHRTRSVSRSRSPTPNRHSRFSRSRNRSMSRSPSQERRKKREHKTRKTKRRYSMSRSPSQERMQDRKRRSRKSDSHSSQRHETSSRQLSQSRSRSPGNRLLRSASISTPESPLINVHNHSPHLHSKHKKKHISKSKKRKYSEKARQSKLRSCSPNSSNEFPSKESSHKTKLKKSKKKHSHHHRHSDKNKDQDIETMESIDTRSITKDSSRRPGGVEYMGASVEDVDADQATTIPPGQPEDVNRIETINEGPGQPEDVDRIETVSEGDALNVENYKLLSIALSPSGHDDEMDSGFADGKNTLTEHDKCVEETSTQQSRQTATKSSDKLD